MRYVMIAVLTMLAGGPAQAQAPCEMPPADEPFALSRPVGGSIIREFGESWDDLAQKKTHYDAVALDAPPGEPVYAARTGRVVEVGAKGNIGTTIRIDHGGGVETVYGHLAQTGARPGQCVKGGEQIAKAGSSGVTPGPRLYFGLRRDGKPADPTPFLQ